MEGVCWWSGVSCTTSTATGLNGVAQQVLGDRHLFMGSCRAGALSGIVVASSAGSTKFMRISTLKIARRFEGGGGFCSVYVRCSLRVC